MSAEENSVNIYEYNLSRSDWENLIEQWVFSERDRNILKRRLLDGVTYENLSEEFDLSVRQTKNIVYKLEKILFRHI